MHYRNTPAENTDHSSVKFGNGFCTGLLAAPYQDQRTRVCGKGKYIYPIFEILN